MRHDRPERRPPGRLHPAARRARRRRRARARALAALALPLAIVGIVLLAANGGGTPRRAEDHARSGLAPQLIRHGSRAGGQESSFASLARRNRHILSYTGYVSVGTRRRREIALTFDDGPSPFTPRVLRLLERFHAKATFFEIGRQVLLYRRLTARLSRAGMAIGDHTEDHPPLALLAPARQAAELDQDARAIRAAGAPWPLLFRPPYGSFDSATLQLLRKRDMLMVLWTVDTRDYARPGVKQIVYTALSGARPGAIILFHDGGGDRSQTLAALPRIIERLRQRGYRLVTVPKLLHDDPPPAGQGPPPSGLAGI